MRGRNCQADASRYTNIRTRSPFDLLLLQPMNWLNIEISEVTTGDETNAAGYHLDHAKMEHGQAAPIGGVLVFQFA